MCAARMHPQTKSVDYKSFLHTRGPAPTHDRHIHTRTQCATAHTLARARKRRRVDGWPRGCDVDGSRFNGGCNYIANEPEVETVRALLRPKERLYTLELRRSTAIDRRRRRPLHITLTTSIRDGEMRETASFPTRNFQSYC